MNDGTSGGGEGLQAGDKIVVARQYRLQPGSAVKASATTVGV